MHITLLLATLSLPITFAAAATCPTTIIQNGGFETGTIASWTLDILSGGSNTNYGITTPGSSGRYAFTAYVNPGGIPYSDGSERLGQVLSTCAGKNYSIIADIKFSQTASNDCSVKLEYPYKYERGSVTVPSGLGPVGVWQTIGMYSYTSSFLLMGSGGLEVKVEVGSDEVADPLCVIGATFQAVSSGSQIYFYFTCLNRRSNVISLDNVRVAPYNGNAY